MAGQSPLGRYADIGAFLASLGAVVAAIIAHLLGQTDPFLDTLAVLGFGVLIGQRGAASQAQAIAAAKLNGQEAKIDAAHKRLDEIHAPPAAIPATPPGS